MKPVLKINRGNRIVTIGTLAPLHKLGWKWLIRSNPTAWIEL